MARLRTILVRLLTTTAAGPALPFAAFGPLTAFFALVPDRGKGMHGESSRPGVESSLDNPGADRVAGRLVECDICHKVGVFLSPGHV